MVPEFALGSQFGSFTLVEELGRGGDSVVYRASHPTLGRDLALKIFATADESTALAALTASGVAHPAIVPAYDSGVTDSHAWLAMRCITGVDLHTWLQQSEPELADVISIVRQVASALDAMDAAEHPHGDVKPSNILLTTGVGRPDRVRAYLVDPLPTDSNRSTLDYAAPERIRGEGPSAGADQYALACVAFQCLTGSVPYPAATMSEAINAHLRDPSPSLPERLDRGPSLTSALDVVLGSALSVRPADRFASCTALAAAMDRADLAATRPRLPVPGEPPPWPTVAPGSYGYGYPQGFAPGYGAQGSAPDYGSQGSAPPPPTTAGWDAEEQSVRPDWGMLTCTGPSFEEVLGSIRVGAHVAVEKVPDNESADDRTDVVDCSVFAPPKLAPGSMAMVQVFVHKPEQAQQAAAEATEFDDEAARRGVRTLEAPIGLGEQLTFDLSVPNLDVVDPVQQVVWHGRPSAAQFVVTAPSNLTAPHTTIGTVSVSRAGVPLGNLRFKLQVANGADSSVISIAGHEANRFKRAFVSYASIDRAAVLARVQILRAAQIEYFQDVDMEPGERWERQLYKQIDGCDLFLLFWSQAAKESTWVRREVDYALGLGDECPVIRPVVIEGPPAPSPWDELAQLHFDDRLLSLLATASR